MLGWEELNQVGMMRFETIGDGKDLKQPNRSGCGELNMTGMRIIKMSELRRTEDGRISI